VPRVLVVDDSPVDRHLVGRLLAADVPMEVQFASDGQEAIDLIARHPVDLIVADLDMPAADGLDLVDAVAQSKSPVPIVLMTAKGSETLAVAALQRGAAGYVPKRSLAKLLLPTVQRTLALSERQSNVNRLMTQMVWRNEQLHIDNDHQLILPLVQYLQQCVWLNRHCDATGRVRIGVALEEALVNALYHGNLEVDSALRSTDRKQYRDLVQQRLQNPFYCDRQIHVRLTISPEKVIFVIRDEGPGFDTSRIAQSPEAPDLDSASGRGMLLIRAFMDEVVYNSVGNEVTLVKRAEAVLQSTPGSE